MARLSLLLIMLTLPFTACLGSDDASSTPTPTVDAPGAATVTSEPAAVAMTPTSTQVPAVTPTQPEETSLDGTAWRLVEMLGEPVDPAWEVTLEFRDGKIDGWSGCNAFGASYSASLPDSITIEGISTNEEGCPAPLVELNFQERYYDALNVSVRYILGGNGQLALQHANGDTLLLFNPIEVASANPTPAQQPAGPTPTTPVADDGNWEVYVMNADGSDQRRPAPSLAGESWPAWMPDGRLSFFSGRTGEQRVFAVLPDGSGLEELPIDPAAFTSGIEWSSDGSQIYYASNIDSLEQLYVADADGSNPRRITEIADGTFLPDWSPDGSRVVFSNYSHGPPQLYLVNADGSGLQRLTFEQEAAFEAPAWSPDGTQIAVGRYPNFEPGGISIIDADGSDMRPLTQSEYDDHSPAWSPDGSRIAFVRESDIWVINVDGTGLTRLTDNVFSDGDPVWSPDGSQLAFTSNRDGGQPIECSFGGINDYIGIESLDQLAWISDMIVVGTVVERLPSAFGTAQYDGPAGPSYPIYTDYLIEVDTWIRGVPQPTVRLRQNGGTVGACSQIYDSEPVVGIGDRLLLFLHADDFNADLPPAGFLVGGFQGYWPVNTKGAVDNQQSPEPDGTPVEQLATTIRDILRQPPPDYPDLVPLEEAPVADE